MHVETFIRCVTDCCRSALVEKWVCAGLSPRPLGRIYTSVRVRVVDPIYRLSAV